MLCPVAASSIWIYLREDETAPKGVFINSFHNTENQNVKQSILRVGVSVAPFAATPDPYGNGTPSGTKDQEPRAGDY